MPVETEDASTAASILSQSKRDFPFLGEILTAVPNNSIAMTEAALVEILAAQMAQPQRIPIAIQFDERARTWKQDSRFMSSLAKMVVHPSYQAIIGMGRDALPFILSDLEHSRDHWLWALHAITQENPAPKGADFDTAVDAWLAWGRTHGYL